MGKQRTTKLKEQGKTLKGSRPIIKIYLGDKKKHQARRQKKKRTRNIWGIDNPF
jgi:hypothetical protein